MSAWDDIEDEFIEDYFMDIPLLCDAHVQDAKWHHQENFYGPETPFVPF